VFCYFKIGKQLIGERYFFEIKHLSCQVANWFFRMKLLFAVCLAHKEQDKTFLEGNLNV
jgi:hypothetical protein